MPAALQELQHNMIKHMRILTCIHQCCSLLSTQIERIFCDDFCRSANNELSNIWDRKPYAVSKRNTKPRNKIGLEAENGARGQVLTRTQHVGEDSSVWIRESEENASPPRDRRKFVWRSSWHMNTWLCVTTAQHATQPNVHVCIQQTRRSIT